VVDPFLGFQVVLVVASVLALLTGVVIAPFLPGGFGALTDQASEGFKIFIACTVIFGLFVQNGLFVGVVGYYLQRYGVHWRDIGLGRLTRNQLLLGLGLGLAMFAVASVAEHFLTIVLERTLPQRVLEFLKSVGESVTAGAQFLKLPGPVAQLLFAIGGAVAAPIGEEVYFRGFLFNALRVRHTRTLALVVSALAFALVHASPVAILIIFPMGILLAYVYERTQSLWVTILMHAVNNGMSFLLLALFPESGR
jgi:membrane protease YdiL (CAAX protease family)